MEFLAKGKRGVVHRLVWKGKQAVIKTKRESSAVDTLVHEANMLQLVNTRSIGPRYFAFENGLIMEYVDGQRLDDYVRTHPARTICTTLRTILRQCRTLDKLRLNKFELHHPHKHVIITKKGPVMIDFERCRFSEHPKNVTQFVQFLTSTAFGGLLRSRGVHVSPDVREQAKQYKNTYAEAPCKRMLDGIHTRA
ncbi:MAG: hypothetical protein V1725_04095 [archaeon]